MSDYTPETLRAIGVSLKWEAPQTSANLVLHASAWEATEQRLEATEKENKALRQMWYEQFGDHDAELDTIIEDYISAFAALWEPQGGRAALAAGENPNGP